MWDGSTNEEPTPGYFLTCTARTLRHDAPGMFACSAQIKRQENLKKGKPVENLYFSMFFLMLDYFLRLICPVRGQNKEKRQGKDLFGGFKGYSKGMWRNPSRAEIPRKTKKKQKTL